MEDRERLIEKLKELGYLDPNINLWGIQVQTAIDWFIGNNDLEFETLENIYEKLLLENPKKIYSQDTFCKNIIEEIIHQGFWLSRGLLSPNIIYIDNCNTSGLQLPNSSNYNDLRLILIVEHSGLAYIKSIWNATINRGNFYGYYQTKNTIQTPQQTWSWILKPLSKLVPEYEILTQVRPVSVINKLFSTEILDFEVAGINHGYGNYGVAGQFCASPLSVEGLENHKEFTNILKQDKRYFMNKNYIFGTIFLNGYKCSLMG